MNINGYKMNKKEIEKHIDDLFRIIKEKQLRIDKAIEYIEEILNDDYEYPETKAEAKELLDILKGSK